MTPLPALMHAYWNAELLEVNLLVFANLVGALLLGLIVGYERSYHGRAAGMRTYGIVCMASAALTVFAGYPGFWWGGLEGSPHLPADPTRVIQGIVTGVGFLGAGVIMKEGMNISGLTTAASIWASSAIGVLVGVGFYAAAILLALLSATLMMWGSHLEMRLPSRRALGVSLEFAPGFEPCDGTLRQHVQAWGYALAEGSLHVAHREGRAHWQFVMVAQHTHPSASSLFELARLLRQLEGLDGLQITHARN